MYLRHSFASLMIHSCASIAQVADWMGNSAAITLKHYLGIFSEVLEPIDADELVEQARNLKPDMGEDTAQAA